MKLEKAKIIGRMALDNKAIILGTVVGVKAFQKAQGEAFKRKEYFRTLNKGKLVQTPFSALKTALEK